MSCLVNVKMAEDFRFVVTQYFFTFVEIKQKVRRLSLFVWSKTDLQVGSLRPVGGGHLIGNQFDGPNDAINIVPQRRSLNRNSQTDGAWYRMEMGWATQIRGGEKVKVEINIQYSGVDRRPTRFVVFEEIGNRGKQLALSSNN